MYLQSPEDYEKFFNLIDRMLKINPYEIITPKDAIKHPFFTVICIFLTFQSREFMKNDIKSYFNEFKSSDSNLDCSEFDKI